MQIIFIFKRQMKAVYSGGPSVFLRKCYTLFLMFLAPFGVLALRLLRPFILIRFTTLISSRIGHFAANTELYLCKRDEEANLRRTLDIFYLTSPICNQQLRIMLERTLHVFNFVRYIDRLNRSIPGGKVHEIPLPLDLNTNNIFARIPAHLRFSPEEERLGSELIRKMGIPESTPFICFYARDPVYLKTKFPGQDWCYHDYRDSDIANYLPAAEELTKRGYFAIRMGAIVKQPLRTTNTKIIDYAVNCRSDFLDIFLPAKCRFFIVSTGGISTISQIFRRPLVYVNFIPLGIEHLFSCAPGSLIIPKKLWLEREKRFLTIREIISAKADNFYSTEQYGQLNCVVIDNTPGEISAAAIEMDERIKGTWQGSDEDETLQRRFWSFFEPCKLGKPMMRIGAEFLRQNRQILE